MSRKTRSARLPDICMPWLTARSPLRVPQNIVTSVNNTPRPHTMAGKYPSPRQQYSYSCKDLKSLESGFVNDAVVEEVKCRHPFPRRSMIPPYDAARDRYATTYFSSPNIRALLESKKPSSPELKQERNKLSYRHRCKQTPTADEIRVREQRFINDAIVEEKRKNRFHTTIPPYSADQDYHCKGYFNKPGVQKLLSITVGQSPR